MRARRALSFLAAGLVCYVASMIGGYLLWHLFDRRAATSSTTAAAAPTPASPATNQPNPTTAPAASPAPAENAAAAQPTGVPPPAESAKPKGFEPPPGTLYVTGREVTLGGAERDSPLRRAAVGDFAIAETEVTVEQYAEFVRETKHRAPRSWPKGTPPADGAKLPVTDVTWQDAVDYCAWLSSKIGATARLPTEAEWELAARGDDYRQLYPWGAEWKDAGAASSETNGRVEAVKSRPEGVSPFGAYDMAGNVWEWVADQARDNAGQPKSANKIVVAVAKGGSAEESRKFISAASRQELLVNRHNNMLGFRYVVVKKESAPAEKRT